MVVVRQKSVIVAQPVAIVKILVLQREAVNLLREQFGDRVWTLKGSRASR